MGVNLIIAEGDREGIKSLQDAVSNDSKIKIQGSALTGLECVSMVMKFRPDVLLLSTNLHDLDSKSIIERLMRQFPTPVLVIYTSDQLDLITELKRMDIGIMDFLEISRLGNKVMVNDISITTRIHILSKLTIEKFKTQIRQGIHLTRSRQENKSILETAESTVETHSTKPRSNSYSGRGRSSRVIIIGTSTGGPRLLSSLVPQFPANFPPVVIVQHMPIGFINAFAKRLNRISKIRVKEGSSGEPLLPGTVYLAPGGKHLEFHRIGSGMPKILLTDGLPVNFVKPAVDVTLKSAAKVYGSGAICLILTGMGSDGREGSRVIKETGGVVLALNEEDADIYGMNRVVIEAGLADEILSKRDIVLGIIRAIEGKL